MGSFRGSGGRGGLLSALGTLRDVFIGSAFEAETQEQSVLPERLRKHMEIGNNRNVSSSKEEQCLRF